MLSVFCWVIELCAPRRDGGDVQRCNSLSWALIYMPLGHKLFVIAERGGVSTFLRQQSKSLASLPALVLKGPGSWGTAIQICWSDPNAFLVQPPLCCHSVLTLSTGPDLVTGWEAAWAHDLNRGRQLFAQFCFWMGDDSVQHLLSSEHEFRAAVTSLRNADHENIDVP